LKIKGLLLRFSNMKHYLIAATLVFVLGVILGYNDSGSFHALINTQLSQMKNIAEGMKQTDHQQWSWFFLILRNNLLAAFLAFVFGLFFGILPLFYLLSNGILIGYVASHSTKDHTLVYFLKGVIPHGIFEIPAFILACAFGIRLGFLMIEGLWSFLDAKRRAHFSLKVRYFLKQLVPVMGLVCIMLLLAAVIESMLTPLLLK
jgi:stage II sporulation protein M